MRGACSSHIFLAQRLPSTKRCPLVTVKRDDRSIEPPHLLRQPGVIIGLAGSAGKVQAISETQLNSG